MSPKHTTVVQRALDAMAGRCALLVGDFMLDQYLYGEAVRVSREAPVLVVRQERVEHRFGGAANTAANLQALGLQTQLVGAVGADPQGTQLAHLLAAAGADCAGLAQAGTTPVKTRILAGAFGTSRQQVLRLDQEPQSPPSQALLQKLAQEVEQRAPHADVVVVSDYGAGTVQGPVVTAIQRVARSGTPVCVDSRYALRQFAGVTVVTPNVPEVEAIVGFPLADQDAVERAGGILLQMLECEAALITQGRWGMTLFRRNTAPAHVDIVGAQDVTDVTGAGDTVTATVAAALAGKLGLDNGMRLANCAAGVVVSQVGTVSAEPAQIVAAARGGAVELVPWAS